MIITAGDSFVYGSELADCPHDSQPSKNTFAALLAPDSECIAWPGYANDSIARTTIERCNKGDVTGVLVSWSFPGRYEFRFNYDTGQKKSPWYAINSWTIATPTEIRQEYHSTDHYVFAVQKKHLSRAQQTGVAEFAETFFKHVGNSEYWEIYSTLKEIVYLQNYLTVKNIPFMFTCADNSIFYNFTVLQADEVIQSLVSQIDDSKWFWFNPGTEADHTPHPRGFYQWAIENKYPVGTTHPLEEAHREAAQLMQGTFNELVKKSI